MTSSASTMGYVRPIYSTAFVCRLDHEDYYADLLVEEEVAIV